MSVVIFIKRNKVNFKEGGLSIQENKKILNKKILAGFGRGKL